MRRTTRNVSHVHVIWLRQHGLYAQYEQSTQFQQFVRLTMALAFLHEDEMAGAFADIRAAATSATGSIVDPYFDYVEHTWINGGHANWWRVHDLDDRMIDVAAAYRNRLTRFVRTPTRTSMLSLAG
jgi:hypothetical protein